MLKARIKIVPNDMPNDDGEWVIVEMPGVDKLPESRNWLNTSDFYSQYVPVGYHLVAVSSVDKGRVPAVPPFDGVL